MFRQYLLGVSYNNSYTLCGSNRSLEQQELIEHSYMLSEIECNSESFSLHVA
jgi:hypothetical protein